MPFLTKLTATHRDLKNGKWWILHEPLVYQLIGAEQIKITVPAGFESDFASVPRIPVCYLFFANEFQEGAVVHDYLYRTGITDRRTSDRILQEIIIEAGYSKNFAWYVYAGVRIGGWKKWREYRRKL